ncbi:hypothetical protein PFICI_08442 [Pestalotiopsis fici W106-1]|uniref:Uncharacterized protein n=1 Tax=Pestalotiopsis fici (strain W106-1 / CGMCC3.15140) TaxID=1229662 RepID=W3X445_PESFW|nr:uncharacterized protein PFICI_08442 [Pestalotiopsis fici W106-1]ETS80913.1 hypothetical protein PFICI_08442 [Pestalotiopsis fici W106-1]
MSDSTPNQASVGGKAGPIQGGGNTTENSVLSGPNFDNLYLQKRSTDPESVAKRESLSEQQPKKGVIGGMIEKLVSGPAGPNTSQNQ